MPSIVFQVVLPVYGAAALLALALRRAAIRRRTQIDPIMLHPFRDNDTPHAYLEWSFVLGAFGLNLDIVINALVPGLLATHLAVPLLRHSMAAGWLGLSTMTGGLILCCVGVWSMGASWRIGFDQDHPGPLVTTGVFSYIRHPIYAGVMLMACGQALVTADVLSIAVASATLVGLPIQARLEEEFLAGRYGATYLEYCRRTPRF